MPASEHLPRSVLSSGVDTEGWGEGAGAPHKFSVPPRCPHPRTKIIITAATPALKIYLKDIFKTGFVKFWKRKI